MAYFETLPLSRNEMYQNGKFIDNDIYLTSEGKLWNYKGFQPPEDDSLITRNYSNYVIFDNKIYVIGASKINQINQLENLSIKVLRPNDEWDIISISNRPNFIKGAAVVYDNKIHLLGGLDSDGYNGTNKHYTYDGNLTVTLESTDLPIIFSNGLACVLSDGIHLLGGKNYEWRHCLFNGTSWVSLNSIPGRVSSSDLTKGLMCVYNNKIYIFGLLYTTHTEDDGYHLVYDITNGWEELRDLPWKDDSSGDKFLIIQTFIYNNDLYIIVRRSSNHNIKEIIAYKLNDGVWEKSEIDFGIYPWMAEQYDNGWSLYTPSGLLDFNRELEIFMPSKKTGGFSERNTQTVRYKSNSTYTVSDKGGLS